MFARSPAAGGGPDVESRIAHVVEALGHRGIRAELGVAASGADAGKELLVRAADRAAVRQALGEAGLVRLPASFGSGALHFVGYDAAPGEWTHLRVLGDDRPWATVWVALADRLRVLRRRGLGVALLGPDGAGKSSMITAVTEQFLTPVSSIYMGLYQGEEETTPRRRRLPGLGLAANLARQQGRWLTGAYQRLRGRLVLFDRYTHDALLPPDQPPSRLGRLRRRLMAAACPAPDLVVILDAPADALYERKGEHDTALLERHRRRFLDLHRELPESVILDTSGPPGAAARELIALIWAAYARRWR